MDGLEGEIVGVPKAISESVMLIGGHEIRVYQLDNGMRVLDAEDIERFFGGMTK